MPLGSGLRVGTDRVCYQKSSNNPGFVSAKRASLATSNLLFGSKICSFRFLGKKN